MKAAENSITVNYGPLPTLQWDGYSWAGTATLPSWKGFQWRRGAAKAKKPANGVARLTVSVHGYEPQLPTPEQAAAFRYLLENEKAVHAAALRAIKAYYPKQRTRYGYSKEELDKLAPVVSDVGQFRSLLGLQSVHIHVAAKSGISYTGISLACTWDDEHGLGLMMHKKRIIEVGKSDTSLLEWIADRDAKARK